LGADGLEDCCTADELIDYTHTAASLKPPESNRLQGFPDDGSE